MFERKYLVWLIFAVAFLALPIIAKPIYIGSINVNPPMSPAGMK